VIRVLKVLKKISIYSYINLTSFIRLYKLRIKFLNSYIASKVHIVYEDINLIHLSKGTSIENFTTLCVVNYDIKSNNSYFELGENSTIGALSNIRASGGKIIIGKNCLIAQNVSMIAAGHGIKKSDLIVNQPWGNDKIDIVLHDDVWVGANSVILPGVEIMKGAIIGAGSVVTKNVDEYSIVTGIPAKHLRYRVDD
jgi:acetyltransferase-like isoleucine patch superfamily enzyme